MDVSAVIAARQHRPEPFGSVLTWSIGAHAALVVFFVFGPDWHMADVETPKVVMTISLAGAPGPRAGGLSPTGGRNIPVPRPDVPTRAMPPPPPKAEPTMSTQRSRRPVAQPEAVEEPQVGVTRTDTGTRGQGFGLSTGGSGSSGVQLDVSNFCCPEYIEQMVSLIHRNWQQGQGVRGATVMKFTIARSGLIQDVMVERPSGFLALDLASERALLATRLPELPAPFPNPSLTVHITFDYSR
jgi:outer membrane biosynthesis protein TonB